jgi:hypothetical protein
MTSLIDYVEPNNTNCFKHWNHPRPNQKCTSCSIESDCWSLTVAGAGEGKIVWLVKEDKPQMKLCLKCQRNEHYCNALACRIDLAGCLATYHADGKTLKTFLPFTWEEVFNDHQYSGDECIQNSREHCSIYTPVLANSDMATCNKCRFKYCNKEQQHPHTIGCFKHQVNGVWMLTYITKENLV